MSGVHVAFGGHGGGRAVARGGCKQCGGVLADVADCEDALCGCAHPDVRLDVSGIVEGDDTFEEVGIRLESDEDEEAREIDAGGLARFSVSGTDAFEQCVAQEGRDLGVGAQLDFWVGMNALFEDGLAVKLGVTVEEDDIRGELLQGERLVKRGVTPADDADDLVGEQGPSQDAQLDMPEP